MADQQNQYGGSFDGRVGRVSAGGADPYPELNPMAAHEASHPQHPASMLVPQQHPQHAQQAMYQMGGISGLHGVVNNPQFPPQNLFIPPISQHGGNVMTAHLIGRLNMTTGYVGQALGHASPIYTNAGLGLPHHASHQMMVAGGMMPPNTYYQRPPMPRNGASPNSGGSPSPGSDDSDDSTPLNLGGKGKRPSPEASLEPTPPVKGKKARVSKKSKKKKDPNEPQKPVSAYALFFRDTQAAIKGQNPNASFGEVSKIVASMWDSLEADNKGVYKKKTEVAKKEYLKALAAYRASLVSKGVEGDPMFPGQGQPYAPYGANPSFVFPPNTSAGGLPSHPQTQSPQLSPLARKSPLLSSLMTTEGGPQQLMNPPMSQPMPPSAQPMMASHLPLQSSLGPLPPTPPQVPHPTQPQHLSHMTPVPPTSPYMAQAPNTSLGSPVSNMSSDVGSPSGAHHIHKSLQQPSQSQQQQQQQQTAQPQQTTIPNPQQQMSPHHQTPLPHQQHVGAHHIPTPSNEISPSCSNGSCIRSGCTNPAVHNPEWEDEYCSNECVVSHCRDVFSSWVASNQNSAPTYPAPVK